MSTFTCTVQLYNHSTAKHPAVMVQLRVQVRVIGDAGSARWLFVDLTSAKTIGDVAERLYTLHPDVPRGTLTLTGAELPRAEHAAILRDGDVVRVARCRPLRCAFHSAPSSNLFASNRCSGSVR